MKERTEEEISRETEVHSFLHNIIAKVVLSDLNGLKGLNTGVLKLGRQLARKVELLVAPLEDPKIAYGYALALNDMLLMSERMVVPSEKLGFLINNPKAYEALNLLAGTPTGVMRKEDFLDRVSSVPKESIQSLEDLKEQEFVEQRRLRIVSEVYTIAITPLGTAALEVLGGILPPK